MDVNELLRKYTGSNTGLLRILMGHSRAVADMALLIARCRKIDVDLEFVEQAAMLHDIGVVYCDAPSISCFGVEPYICHGVIGANLLRSEGLPRHALVAERHTGAGLTRDEIQRQQLPLPAEDFLPVTLEEKLICYADKFFSKSRSLRQLKPLAKIREQMRAHGEEVAQRFQELEKLFGDPCKLITGIENLEFELI